MIILSVLLNGDASPASLPLVLPVEAGVVPEVPEARDPERLMVDKPLSVCSTIVALVEDEPGFVVPKA